MKLNILYNFKDGPWGGGNQFLKLIRKHFREFGVYEDNPENANVILFNSYPFNSEYLFTKVFTLLKKYGNKTIIHRLPGPFYYTRGRDIEVDRSLFLFNEKFTDGTIFQSSWSKEKCYELGMKNNNLEKVIINAPDEDIFYSKNSVGSVENKRIKIVASSWSTNMNKGFDIYKYLDENLDFDRYEMTFIGNTAIDFKNIVHIQPVDSIVLADLLRENDIFLTASKNDSCSNSLIEALQCGLPAVVLRSGGNLEAMGGGGVFFDNKNEVLGAIEKTALNLEYYSKKILIKKSTKIAQEYYDFCYRAYQKKIDKKISVFDYLHLLGRCYSWKLKKKLQQKIGF